MCHYDEDHQCEEWNEHQAAWFGFVVEVSAQFNNVGHDGNGQEKGYAPPAGRDAENGIQLAGDGREESGENETAHPFRFEHHHQIAAEPKKMAERRIGEELHRCGIAHHKGILLCAHKDIAIDESAKNEQQHEAANFDKGIPTKRFFRLHGLCWCLLCRGFVLRLVSFFV